jgi:undecaprenyl-diphosphatase
MQNLDITISVFLNSFAHRYWTLDRLANFFNGNLLVRGFLVLALFYFIWFQSKDTSENGELSEKQEILLYTILICVPALVLVRVIAWAMPFRARPIIDPALHLRVAYGFEYQNLLHWSSFPSDTTMLYFLLATGAFLVSRRIGIFLYLHAFFVVSLPRLYLGIHYPSDILGGMVLGCLVGYSANWLVLRSFVIRPALRLRVQSPGLFNACLFFISCETASSYDHVRTALQGGVEVIYALMRQSGH